MAKMIQIRNVPDELHRTLKVRAAKAGMTLSDYLLSEIEQIAEKPTLRELMERLAHDEPPDVTIRRFRDAGDPRDLG
jgi:plasmid stability protein